MEIKDSGQRREFETGAVRDMAEGKGRCDLMPLDVIACLVPRGNQLYNDRFLSLISEYIRYGVTCFLYDAARCLMKDAYLGSEWGIMIELSKHFEAGAAKYGEYNWQKGIETKSYVDSAVRHYLKWRRGDDDESHERACLWNLVCAIWTIEHKPELNSYPVEREEKNG